MTSVLLLRRFLPQFQLTESAQAVAVLCEGLLAADPGQDLQLCLPIPAQVTTREDDDTNMTRQADNNTNNEGGDVTLARDIERGERSKTLAKEDRPGEAGPGSPLEPAQGGLLSDSRPNGPVGFQSAPAYSVQPSLQLTII